MLGIDYMFREVTLLVLPNSLYAMRSVAKLGTEFCQALDRVLPSSVIVWPSSLTGLAKLST